MRTSLVLVWLWACSEPRPPASPKPRPVASVAWKSCLLDRVSPCISDAPVRVGDELIAWSDWLAGHGVGKVECRWVAELEHVLLCGSAEVGAINAALSRASIFIEMKPRVVIERTAHPMVR